MALLSSTTYNRIAKSFSDAQLVLLNERGEYAISKSLVTLAKTKTKINTRWEFEETSNLSPFTHAALSIKRKGVLTHAVQPIQKVEYGYVDIQYENDD